MTVVFKLIISNLNELYLCNIMSCPFNCKC
uniref:Uncharacterized protein n=1 Tax=Anguilla anguilla TaxID=7936 RepID=A0A0E9VVJ5_ANGAN